MYPRPHLGGNPDRAWAFALLGLAGMTAPGCSEELGPEHFPTTRVAGESGRGRAPRRRRLDRVHAGRRHRRQAPVRPDRQDGAFRADRIAIGENVIQTGQRIDRSSRRSAALRTVPLLRRKIPAQPDVPLTIDVFWKRQYVTRPRSPPVPPPVPVNPRREPSDEYHRQDLLSRCLIARTEY